MRKSKMETGSKPAEIERRKTMTKKATTTTTLAAKTAAEPTTKARAVIRYNKAKAGIELVIPDGRRLTTAELEVLRSLSFCWHKREKYWYTKYSDEKMEVIKASFLGKEAQFPAVTETKLMRQMAAEKASATRAAKERKPQSKKESAKTTDSDLEERFAAMEAKMAALVDAVTALAAMQTK